MSTKAPALKETKEYRLFKADPTNRSIRKLNKIIASMKQWGFLPGHPIMCAPNGTGMYIKDGQHRFEAAKTLGIPVYYVCHEKHEGISIPEVNGAAAGAWNPRDYIESYCNQGNVEYGKLRSFIDEYGIPPVTAAILLYGLHGTGGQVNDVLRSGAFKVRDLTHAQKVARVLNAAAQHVKFTRNKFFIDAVSRLLRVPECSEAVLTERMHKYPSLLTPMHDTQSFCQMLESLYNHRQQRPMPLAFMANEVMKGRNPAYGRSRKAPPVPQE